jgi:hypothetical protein
MVDAALSSSVPTSSLSEDWLAVWIGLPIFALALLGVAGRIFSAGTTTVWTDPRKGSRYSLESLCLDWRGRGELAAFSPQASLL